MDKKTNLIITIDDFGMSPEINQRFFDILESCEIDRVSILMNGNVSKIEAEKLLSFGTKLDVHLDLEKKVRVKGDVGKDVLRRGFSFVMKLPFSGSPKKVEKLWEQQILEFKNIFGKNPDGINSHEHVHFFPPYLKKVLLLSKKYNLDFVRFGKESYQGKTAVSKIINLLKKFGPKKIDFQTTEIMASSDWIDDFDFFEKSLGNEKEAEVSFHPKVEKEYEFLKKRFKRSS